MVSQNYCILETDGFQMVRRKEGDEIITELFDKRYKIRDFLLPSPLEAALMGAELILSPFFMEAGQIIARAIDPEAPDYIGAVCALVPQASTYIGFRIYEVCGQYRADLKATKFSRISGPRLLERKTEEIN